MSDEQSDTTLTGHVDAWMAALAKAGYAAKTRSTKRWLIRSFIRWAESRAVPVGGVDEECIRRFLAHRSRRRDGHRTALRQFLTYLRAVGAVPTTTSPASPLELLFRRYLDHLRANQGLSFHSVAVYRPFVRNFIVAQRLPEKAAELEPLMIHRYLVEQSRDRSGSFVRLLVAAVRSFLRFCFLTGTTSTNLSTSLLLVRRSPSVTIPPFLSVEQVERVIAIAARDRSTLRGARAFAIILLLARLGLRASEIIALELDDVRWDVGEIVVRGKGRLHDRLPLPHDVGEALAAYLRNWRGPSSSRAVFLRHLAPGGGLLRPAAVSKIAHEALQRADLLPPGRVGAHIFRHSLATRMIRHGASLAEIAQVLRHRSTLTTKHYAKVELDGLRGVALPWPSTAVMR